MSASPIVFDLTELLLAAGGKTRHYGIARTVAEIGSALRRLDPSVRFCVHSAAHERFFEVPAEIDGGGQVSFDLPYAVRQRRVRSVRAERRPLRDAGAAILRALANVRTRHAWSRAGIDLKPIDMNGTTFVSGASPKVIVEEIATLDRLHSRARIVPLLYDLIPLHDRFQPRRADFPAKFLHDNVRIVERAERLLTISAFTRDEFVRFSKDGVLPPLPAGGVHPVPLVHECPEGTEPPGLPPPTEPYLLTVGAMLGRKNLEAVLDALSHMRASGGPMPRLVIAGAGRRRTEEHLASNEREDVRDLVEFRHAPTQSDLVALYRDALATVVASRMEGWGLPAGESLWFGTPAICADVPALREVAGELGLYFDPDDADGLVAEIIRLMTDVPFATALRDRIVQAKPTLRTWADVAKDLMHGLEDRSERGSTRFSCSEAKRRV